MLAQLLPFPACSANPRAKWPRWLAWARSPLVEHRRPAPLIRAGYPGTQPVVPALPGSHDSNGIVPRATLPWSPGPQDGKSRLSTLLVRYENWFRRSRKNWLRPAEERRQAESKAKPG